MNDSKHSLIEGLLRAVKMETDGRNFYLIAAQTTQDPKGREVFQTLADEELSHLNFLKSHYESISTSGLLNPSISLGKPGMLEEQNPIFSNDILTRIGSAHYEMTALSIAIQLELNSIKYYEERAREETEPQARTFYSELAKWESLHYHALLRQQDTLKESYWTANGFAPF